MKNKKRGELLKRRRIELGLTQAAVAASCSVDRSAVAHWERGVMMRAMHAIVLSTELNLEILAMVRGEYEPKAQFINREKQ